MPRQPDGVLIDGKFVPMQTVKYRGPESPGGDQVAKSKHKGGRQEQADVTQPVGEPSPAQVPEPVSLKASILIALQGAGPQGLTMDDLNYVIPGCKEDLDALMAEGLVGHPPVTTRLYVLMPRGRAFMALRSFDASALLILGESE